MGIADLNAEDRKNLFMVRTEDGSVFDLMCREAAEKEDRWKNTNGQFIMDEVLLKKRRRRFFYRANGWNGQDFMQG